MIYKIWNNQIQVNHRLRLRKVQRLCRRECDRECRLLAKQANGVSTKNVRKKKFC